MAGSSPATTDPTPTAAVATQGSASGRARADVIFTFARVTWQAATQRDFCHSEDRLALSLMHSDRVGRLLICNHARNGAVLWARRLARSEVVAFPTTPDHHLVEPRSLRRRDPTTSAAVKRAYASYDRTLARAAARHGLRDVHVITGNPMVAAFCELSWAPSTTWYAIDDWAEHPAYGAWRDLYLEAYDRVRERGRGVAAVSRALLDRLAPSGPGIVVPNGVDPAEWATPSPAPAWMAALPTPVFLYVGALDSRIDIEWVRRLALAEPSATVLFVGALVEPEHMAPLHDLANVQIRPSVGRAELRALIANADVGLLPHVVSRLTVAMSPLKLQEYLAAGLPVAATDLEPVRSLANPSVVLVPEGGDFTAGVRSAVALGRAPERARLEFLSRNSWQARHDRVVELAIS